MISKDQIQQIMPNVTAEHLEKFCQPLNEAMDKFEINTPQRIAAFLAQIAVESAQLSATVENLNYSAEGLLKIFPTHFKAAEVQAFAHHPEQIANRAYCNRLGNGDEASGDGWRFRGRGLLQTTGRTNYDLVGKGIGADLVNHPENLEGPLYATDAATWYWKSRGLNDLADKGDFKQITLRINGGLNGYDMRLSFWDRAKKTLI